MKKILFILLMMISIISAAQLFATEDFYHFDSEIKQERFKNLTLELRCLVCQNQNLAESNATLAVDLREKIYQQVQQGQSDKEIIDYLVARYGNFILYRPPFNGLTLALWLGPFLFLLVGVVCLLRYRK